MARLELLSDSTFQAVLHHLDIQHYASLRLVSHATHQLTNQHVTHVSIRLSNSTTQQNLHQWCHATRNLRHVRNLHIHIAGKVSTEVFGAALQQLSQHIHVTELHLLAVVFVESQLQSLTPVQHLLPQLQALVVEGIAVPSLADDLVQSTASSAAVKSPDGGWQLQRLALDVYWSTTAMCAWSGGLSILKQLPSVFPNLQQFTLHLPGMYHPNQGPFYGAAADAAVSFLANLLFAALSLKELQTFTEYRLPDVWLPVEYNFSIVQPAVVVAAAQLAATATAAIELATIVNAADKVQSSLALTASAAAAAMAPAALFATLDSYGCWLLKHHVALKRLTIHTEWGWRMSWHHHHHHHQQQQQIQQQQLRATPLDERPTEHDSTSNGTTTTQLQTLTATCSAHAPEEPLHIINSKQSPALRLQRYISCYSCHPASSVISQIKELCLEIRHDEIDDLADLLRDQKLLARLEVQMVRCYDPNSSADFPVAILAIRAAAAVQQLQSLCLKFYDLELQQLPNNLLLPLTAAAGGPGSSLTRLHLHGSFAATSEEEALWLHILQQLDGLQELSIKHTTFTRGRSSCSSARIACKISVDNLPSSLRDFRGEMLHLVSDGVAVGQEIVAAAGEEVGSSSKQAAVTAPNSRLQLQCLHLTRCQLSSPSILASQQLHDLSVCDDNGCCSWPGGWAAAATAWPNIRTLSWSASYASIPNRTSELSRAGSRRNCKKETDARQTAYASVFNAACVRIDEELQSILNEFKGLKHLNMKHLPCLSIAMLQLTIQQRRITRVVFDLTNCVQLTGLSDLTAPYLQTNNGSSSSSSSSSSSKGVAQLEAVQL